MLIRCVYGRGAIWLLHLERLALGSAESVAAEPETDAPEMAAPVTAEGVAAEGVTAVEGRI